MTDLKKLRELAQKATPGPWNVGFSNQGAECVWLNGETEPNGEMGPDRNWIDCNSNKNSTFIAAVNPITILALLDRLEAAERDAAAYRSLRDGNAGSLFVARLNYVCDEYPECVNVDELTGASLDAAIKEQDNGV